MRKRLITIILAAIVAAEPGLMAAAQSSIWSERRQARTPAAPVLARLPASASSGISGSLLGAMPALTTWSIGEPGTASRSDRFRRLTGAIPAGVGRLVALSPEGRSDAPVVALIQDVHLHEEAQRNIAALFRRLSGALGDRDRPLLIGVEGAFGPFDFASFRDLPDPDVTRDVADAFLRAGWMAAPSHVGIVDAGLPVSFVGVDDRALYFENVRAVRAADALRAPARARLNEERRALSAVMAKALNPALARFAAARRDYETAAIPLGVYLERLAALPEADLVTGAMAAPLRQFRAAFQLERDLDLSRVEAERARLLRRLAERIDATGIRELTALGSAHKAGGIGFGDYYRGLTAELERAGVPLASAPHFERYIRYVLLADGLQPDRVLAGLRRLEERLVDVLARDPRERRWMRQARRLALAEKLIDFALTAGEWEELKSDLDPAWEVFAAFYRAADARSGALLDNLLGAADGRDFAAMVVGGFHTQLLEEELRHRDIAYAVIRPEISTIEGDGNAYLSAFVQERGPLDKIFSGDRLFLALYETAVGRPVAAGRGRMLRVVARVLSAWRGRPVTELRRRGDDDYIDEREGGVRARLTRNPLSETAVSVGGAYPAVELSVPRTNRALGFLRGFWTRLLRLFGRGEAADRVPASAPDPPRLSDGLDFQSGGIDDGKRTPALSRSETLEAGRNFVRRLVSILTLGLMRNARAPNGLISTTFALFYEVPAVTRDLLRFIWGGGPERFLEAHDPADDAERDWLRGGIRFMHGATLGAAALAAVAVVAALAVFGLPMTDLSALPAVAGAMITVTAGGLAAVSAGFVGGLAGQIVAHLSFNVAALILDRRPLTAYSSTRPSKFGLEDYEANLAIAFVRLVEGDEDRAIAALEREGPTNMALEPLLARYFVYLTAYGAPYFYGALNGLLRENRWLYVRYFVRADGETTPMAGLLSKTDALRSVVGGDVGLTERLMASQIAAFRAFGAADGANSAERRQDAFFLVVYAQSRDLPPTRDLVDRYLALRSRPQFQALDDLFRRGLAENNWDWFRRLYGVVPPMSVPETEPVPPAGRRTRPRLRPASRFVTRERANRTLERLQQNSAAHAPEMMALALSAATGQTRYLNSRLPYEEIRPLLTLDAVERLIRLAEDPVAGARAREALETRTRALIGDEAVNRVLVRALPDVDTMIHLMAEIFIVRSQPYETGEAKIRLRDARDDLPLILARADAPTTEDRVEWDVDDDPDGGSETDEPRRLTTDETLAAGRAFFRRLIEILSMGLKRDFLAPNWLISLTFALGYEVPATTRDFVRYLTGRGTEAFLYAHRPGDATEEDWLRGGIQFLHRATLGAAAVAAVAAAAAFGVFGVPMIDAPALPDVVRAIAAVTAGALVTASAGLIGGLAGQMAAHLAFNVYALAMRRRPLTSGRPPHERILAELGLTEDEARLAIAYAFATENRRPDALDVLRGASLDNVDVRAAIVRYLVYRRALSNLFLNNANRSWFEEALRKNLIEPLSQDPREAPLMRRYFGGTASAAMRGLTRKDEALSARTTEERRRFWILATALVAAHDNNVSDIEAARETKLPDAFLKQAIGAAANPVNMLQFLNYLERDAAFEDTLRTFSILLSPRYADYRVTLWTPRPEEEPAAAALDDLRAAIDGLIADLVAAGDVDVATAVLRLLRAIGTLSNKPLNGVLTLRQAQANLSDDELQKAIAISRDSVRAARILESAREGSKRYLGDDRVARAGSPLSAFEELVNIFVSVSFERERSPYSAENGRDVLVRAQAEVLRLIGVSDDAERQSSTATGASIIASIAVERPGADAAVDRSAIAGTLDNRQFGGSDADELRREIDRRVRERSPKKSLVKPDFRQKGTRLSFGFSPVDAEAAAALSPNVIAIHAAVAAALARLFDGVHRPRPGTRGSIRVSVLYHVYADRPILDVVGRATLSDEVKAYFLADPNRLVRAIDDDFFDDIISELGRKRGFRGSIAKFTAAYLTRIYRYETAPTGEALRESLDAFLGVADKLGGDRADPTERKTWRRFTKAVGVGRVKVITDAGPAYDEKRPISALDPVDVVAPDVGVSIARDGIDAALAAFRRFVADQGPSNVLYIFPEAIIEDGRAMFISARDGRIELSYGSATFSEIAGQLRLQRQEGALGHLRNGRFLSDWYMKPMPENAHEWPTRASAAVARLLDAGAIARLDLGANATSILGDLHVALGLAYDERGVAFSRDSRGNVRRGNPIGLRADLRRYPAMFGVAFGMAQAGADVAENWIDAYANPPEIGNGLPVLNPAARLEAVGGLPPSLVTPQAFIAALRWLGRPSGWAIGLFASVYEALWLLVNPVGFLRAHPARTRAEAVWRGVGLAFIFTAVLGTYIALGGVSVDLTAAGYAWRAATALIGANIAAHAVWNTAIVPLLFGDILSPAQREIVEFIRERGAPLSTGERDVFSSLLSSAPPVSTLAVSDAFKFDALDRLLSRSADASTPVRDRENARLDWLLVADADPADLVEASGIETRAAAPDGVRFSIHALADEGPPWGAMERALAAGDGDRAVNVFSIPDRYRAEAERRYGNPAVLFISPADGFDIASLEAAAGGVRAAGAVDVFIAQRAVPTLSEPFKRSLEALESGGRGRLFVLLATLLADGPVAVRVNPARLNRLADVYRLIASQA